MTTPFESYPHLAAALGIPELRFKREDMHPYGSHKGRSIPVMIDTYMKKGEHRFAISSSGNAALAAALYVRELNAAPQSLAKIDLDIFVGMNISPHKLEKLKALSDEHIRILTKERPLQALTDATNEGMRSLRQSTDDTALIGYESLAQELTEVKDAGAVFIGTSSGTTAQALASYFLNRKFPIQVHIVQTSSCHPISEGFGPYDGPDERSVADAIVDITAQRKFPLISLINKTGGRGWFATNDTISTAQELVEKNTRLEISANSALSVVGVMQAMYTGLVINGVIVCLICGE